MAGHASADNHDHHEPLSPISPVSGHSDDNVFGDEYAESFNESYAPSIAAPSIRQPRSASPSPDRSSFQRAPSQRSTQGVTSPFADPPVRSRSSVRKSLQDGGQEGSSRDLRRGSASLLATGFGNSAHPGSSITHRSTSSASSFAASQSASSGSEGPSHPYAMYPQGLGMSRTTSVASTARPMSQVRGPAHPYGLYTQNVNDDLPASGHQNSIPIGFPGSTQAFHRRVGPDGEEQDIIGPDGHTEQLPPYSRYPDEINHKTVAQSSALPSIGEQRAEETSPISPPPPARLNSTPVQAQQVSGGGEPAERGQDMNEKWDGKSTREKWTTKVFGVPLWFLLLFFIAVVIIAVICGAVLGALIGSKHHPKRPPHDKGGPPWPDAAWPQTFTTSSSPSSTSTSFIDVASPTATPNWIAPPPPGNYSVQVGLPVVNVSGCLLPQQRPAWSCLLHDETSVLTITSTPNGTVMSLIDTNPLYQYGTQPPVVTSDQVQLVQDPETDDHAYAWHFQTTYDKLVVLDVNNGLLPLPSSSKQKRDHRQPWYATGFTQKSTDSDDDSEDMDNVDDNQAWFCYWNQTFLEVLVYAGNTSNATNPSWSGSASSSPLSTSSLPLASTSPPPSSSSPVHSTSIPSISYVSSPSGTFWPNWGHGPQVLSTTAIPASATQFPPRNEEALAKRGGSSSSTASASPSPSQPKIKIEERRVANPAASAMTPTCTLMGYGNDGVWRPFVKDSGIIPVVGLKEMDPPSPSGLRKRDSIPTDACGCQWNSPNGAHP